MENKTCTKCSQTKPLNEFRRDNSTKTGYRQPCQKCNATRSTTNSKSKYANDAAFREQAKQRANEKNKRLREYVLSIYGGFCVCCGEDEPKFLAIDHINSDGAAHRKELKIKSGIGFYKWLKKVGFPKDRFQLLCHNCNSAKGFYGVCPHQEQH